MTNHGRITSIWMTLVIAVIAVTTTAAAQSSEPGTKAPDAANAQNTSNPHEGGF